MKQNLVVEKDFYRLRAVLKGFNADDLAKHLINRHNLEGRKTALIMDNKNILVYAQRRKKSWKPYLV